MVSALADAEHDDIGGRDQDNHGNEPGLKSNPGKWDANRRHDRVHDDLSFQSRYPECMEIISDQVILVSIVQVQIGKYAHRSPGSSKQGSRHRVIRSEFNVHLEIGIEAQKEEIDKGYDQVITVCVFQTVIDLSKLQPVNHKNEEGSEIGKKGLVQEALMLEDFPSLDEGHVHVEHDQGHDRCCHADSKEDH